MSEHPTDSWAADRSPAQESPWVDDSSYPHGVENHVKVYLHLEESWDAPRGRRTGECTRRHPCLPPQRRWSSAVRHGDGGRAVPARAAPVGA
jgi:hypothetical protein